MEFNERISAVYFLQRFVRMSQALLPTFHELVVKKNPMEEEEEELASIMEIYDEFNIDPQISIVLVNSPIVQLIIDVYNGLKRRMGATPEDQYTYDTFCRESDRLILAWEKQLMN